MNLPDIFIMGFGKMPADCAAILVKNDVPIHGIFETERTQFSSLEGFANKTNITFLRPGREDSNNLLRSLREPTVIFSINNNYIFPEDICQKENLRIINFHGSLLPRYPGHGKVIPAWVVFNGESRHGVTWHLVNAGIDAGDILYQADFAISEIDTALKVMMRVISLGTGLFSKYWQKFIAPQCEGTSHGHIHDRVYRGRDIPNDGHVDISWDFPTMSRFLRSMDYGLFKLLPSPTIELNGRQYIVKNYRIINKENDIPTNEIQIDLDSDKKDSEVNLLYNKGIIHLTLKEEGNSG